MVKIVETNGEMGVTPEQAFTVFDRPASNPQWAKAQTGETQSETDGQNHDAATRLGRFSAPVELINRSFRDALAAMQGVVVLRAESRDGVIHYVGLCGQFAALRKGDEIPEYHCILTRMDGEVSARWEMIPSGTNGRVLHWED